MTVIGRLERPYGKARIKIASFAVAVTGTAIIDTGFDTIINAQATVVDSSDTIPTTTVSITSVSAPLVDVVLTEHAAAANSVSDTEHVIHLLVCGYQKGTIAEIPE